MQAPSSSSAAAPAGGIPYRPQHDLLHDPVQEDIVMDRWRLQVVLQDVERDSKRSSFEDALPWVGVLLAFLLALIPGDFKPFLGLSGSVWSAVALIGAAYSGYRATRVWWWVFRLRKEPRHTPATVVAQIADEMRTRRAEHAAELAQQALTTLRLPDNVGTPSVSQHPPTSPAQTPAKGADSESNEPEERE